MFQDCFLSVAGQTMQLLSSPEKFAEVPDIVEDFFEMVSEWEG
jgi:hypothetical protein